MIRPLINSFNWRYLFNLDFTLAIGFILYWIIAAIISVGDPPGRTEPYSFWLPIQMAGIVIPPFVLGWLAGNKYNKKNRGYQ